MEIHPNNLLEIYDLYIDFLKVAHPEKRAANEIREIGYTFTSNVLIGLGYTHLPSGTKLTLAQIEDTRQFMKSQELSTLLTLRVAQQEGFKLLDRSQKMRDIYHRSLEKLLSWCEVQPWWPVDKIFQYSPDSQDFCCPLLQRKHADNTTQKLTIRQGRYMTYGLKTNEISAELRMELNELHQFLTKPEHPERIEKAVKQPCADSYQRELLLFLGWFHRFEKIPLEQLKLNLLIPKLRKPELRKLAEKEQKKRWKQSRRHVEAWISRYFTFLRESMQSISPRTRNGKIDSLSALGRFQYRAEVEVSSDYHQIEVLKAIENHRTNNSRKIKEWNRNKRFVADQEQKWPEAAVGQTALTAVHQNLLEPLRLACLPKCQRNKKRKGSAIAQSEQRFLVWFLLAGMPARRQEEYRDLKLTLSCPVQRPPLAELPGNGVYHPLPPANTRDQRHDGTVADNYIYKTHWHNGQFFQEGLWVLDIQEYKGIDVYGPQAIVIKNRRFEDGTDLYAHFEHYLYGWWLPGGRKHQQIYDWWDSTLIGRRGRWVGSGRASLEPCDACAINHDEQSGVWGWGYFFIGPESGTPHRGPQFTLLVETAAKHYTGKQTSPHIMRSVWATWAYQVGLTDQQKESLAYAMGHSIETLRALYERSSPDERRRPIEEVVDRLLFDNELLSQPMPESPPIENVSSDSSSLKEKLLGLSTAQKQQLMTILAQKGGQ